MKRIFVDFNALKSAPVDLVTFPQDGTPPLAEGELEVEVTVMAYVTPWGERRLMAGLGADTWPDLIPQDVPISTAPLAD